METISRSIHASIHHTYDTKASLTRLDSRLPGGVQDLLKEGRLIELFSGLARRDVPALRALPIAASAARQAARPHRFSTRDHKDCL